MAARGDAYKAIAEEDFTIADGLFSAEITKAVDNLVDLLTGRARSRVGLRNFHGAVEDCNTALRFDEFNLIALYYLGFSYFHLKQYNEAREALARCPKVEGLFNANRLLLEVEEAAAAAEEAAAAEKADAAAKEASPGGVEVAELLMSLQNANHAEPDPADPADPAEPVPVANLWTQHYTKSLTKTDIGSKLSLKQVLGKLLVEEAAVRVAGVHADSKMIDIMLQINDEEQDRRKFILCMQDRKDSVIRWNKERNLLKDYNLEVGTQMTFYHRWINQDDVEIPLLKLEYNI